ncbi:sensor histidine kinase [Massilia sp. Se16.2.3]|uniref:sensor histidine kinase n=1 Tax=unclassified Massilia TaxID=2609279 RepID=UPI0035A68D98
MRPDGRPAACLLAGAAGPGLHEPGRQRLPGDRGTPGGWRRPGPGPAGDPQPRRRAVPVPEFEDSGCGIPEAAVGRIYDPFFSTKPPGEGTGLGLSISFGIVERHGGSLRVRSTVGAGTCFTVQLPLAAPGGA